MNTPDNTYALPPSEYREDTSSILDPTTIVERDYDLIDHFLAGTHPEVPQDYADYDPFADLDPDVLKEYERYMDELRAIRENNELRELGHDPAYEI